MVDFTLLLIHEVTIHHPVDDPLDEDTELYGDVKWTYVAGETVPARIQHGAKGGNEDTSEVIIGKDQVLSDYMVFLPPGTNIAATDMLEFEGVMYRVNGKPSRFWDAIGEHHIQANLMKVEGG